MKTPPMYIRGDEVRLTDGAVVIIAVYFAPNPKHRLPELRSGGYDVHLPNQSQTDGFYVRKEEIEGLANGDVENAAFVAGAHLFQD